MSTVGQFMEKDYEKYTKNQRKFDSLAFRSLFEVFSWKNTFSSSVASPISFLPDEKYP